MFFSILRRMKDRRDPEWLKVSLWGIVGIPQSFA